MSLGQKLVEKLQLMQRMEEQTNSSLRNADGASRCFVAQESVDSVDAKVEAPDLDKYSFLVSKLELHHRGVASANSRRAVLQQQANAIAGTINYLAETLKLVEIDTPADRAQIRSEQPEQRKNARRYYEIILDGGNNLTFCRFEKKQKGSKRDIIPFLLTEEVFARLVDDLARVFHP